jgi:hypothetical protein
MPPAREHPRQAEDERRHLGWDRGTAAEIRPPVRPRASAQLAMPREDRVRLAQEQAPVERGARPGGQPAYCDGEDGEDQLLGACESRRAVALTLADTQLLPQDEEREVFVAVAVLPTNDHVNNECPEMREYGPEQPALRTAR